MAQVLFQLPKELLVHTLSFLQPDELASSFGLHELLYADDGDPFTQIRQLALWAKYLDRNVAMSNNVFEGLNQLDLLHLKYLIKYNILIRPKEISFVLFDFTNYAGSYKYFEVINAYYLEYLKKFTDCFSIQLILVENVEIDNYLVKSMFEPFNLNNFKINWFTIKYLPNSMTGNQQFDFEDLNERNAEYRINDFLKNNDGLMVENLKLHLFSSNNLLHHLRNDPSSDNACFYCNSLKTIDFSYNNLKDDDLQNINFPQLLEYLNLSNNNLCFLSNRNFNLTSLMNLKVLNISNNNIMQFNFNTNHLPSDHNYQLEHLDLSGNNLTDYQDLFKTNNLFFKNLTSIDLSRNLISKLSSFPSLLKRINLNGNHLNNFIKELNGEIFPKNLLELYISFCRIVGEKNLYPLFISHLIFEENLFKLRLLEITGGTIDYSDFHSKSTLPLHLQVL